MNLLSLLKKYIVIKAVIFVAIATFYTLNTISGYQANKDIVENSEQIALNAVAQNDDVVNNEITFSDLVDAPEAVKGVAETEQEEVIELLDNPDAFYELPTTSVHQIEDKEYISSEFDFEYDQKLDRKSRLPSAFVPAVNELVDKEVMGFMPYWQLSKYNELQYDKLSTIAYFGLTCYTNGQWVNDAGLTGFNSTNFSNMVSLAHDNGVKVVLVVKNFHNSSIKDIVANANGGGDALIENIVTTVRNRGLDGVNIDFEYIADGSNPVTDTLRANFASWHGKLATRMKSEFPGSQVSTDVFGSSPYGGTAYDLVALGKTKIDYIMMMTYDYITTSCWDGKKMAPMSPLFGNNVYGTPNWNTSTHTLLAGTQAGKAKIIMGVPYYGIDAQVKTSDYNIYNARVDYPNCNAGIETYSTVVDPIYDAYHNSDTIRWNNTEKARWYAYQYAGKWRHGYYDDADSLGAKYQFVRDNGLAGVGIWALGYDSGTTELWNELRDNFQKAPFLVGFKPDVSGGDAVSLISANNLDIVTTIGDGVYRVKPKSGLSATAIAKLKQLWQVWAVGWENDNTLIREIGL